MNTTHDILNQARAAKGAIALSSATQKNDALCAMAAAIVAHKDAILQANAADMQAARGIISDVMLDRLALDNGRVDAMADGLRAVAALPDPLCVRARRTLENGLLLEQVAAPMGVIGIIYESRPNVTADAAALSLKAGSACVLRCGKEAHRSASAIVAAMHEGLRAVGLPCAAVSLIEDTERKSAMAMMQASGLIALLIPRGGPALISSCLQNATVPCIETGTGICHVYVDAHADLGQALDIVENAKASRPSVCNSCEVCLVHRDVAADFLPQLQQRLGTARTQKGRPPVQLRGCAQSCAIIDCTPAEACDFDTEFLDYILAVRVVDSVDDAIAHIADHSTAHSDCIVTEDTDAAARFTKMVDSAVVYVNASTRFTDGGVFGLGCEMGISTQKLHARGPMGLSELCTYKSIVRGTGHVR